VIVYGRRSSGLRLTQKHARMPTDAQAPIETIKALPGVRIAEVATQVRRRFEGTQAVERRKVAPGHLDP
jgi:hypothetical protein